jgi:hypothetical protein
MQSPRLSRILVRILAPAALLLLLLSCPTEGQFRRFGLDTDTVYSIRLYGAKLYAGTQRGAFVRGLSDTSWTLIGLKGKRVTAIYPHSYGAIGYAVTAGIQHLSGDPDSTLTYCTFYSDTSWAPTDTGMDRSRFRYVCSADGFPSPMICGETFAATATTLYRRGSPVWEPVLDLGMAKLNVVRICVTGLTTGMVYVGGETAIFAPFIKRSSDKGETWETATLPNHGDDACYAFAFDPADNLTMYAGMEGSVLISTDGGKAWSTSSLSGTKYYFFALATDAKIAYAGGAASNGPGRSGLYRSLDRGGTWSPISVTDSLGGVLALEVIPTAIPEANSLIVGTMGSGVRIYTGIPAAVREEPIPPAFELHQNYPNPFNPGTAVSCQLSAAGLVRLTVHDLLGREVATLLEGFKEAGRYEVRFDGTGLSSGIYVCRLTVGDQSSRPGQLHIQTRKMVLLR